MTSSQCVPIPATLSARHSRLLRYAFRWFLLRPHRLADIVAAAIVGKAMKAHRSVGGGFFGRAGFVASAIAAVIASPGLPGADGAMAVGIPRRGIAKGYATGFAVNHPTVNAARSNAV